MSGDEVGGFPAGGGRFDFSAASSLSKSETPTVVQ